MMTTIGLFVLLFTTRIAAQNTAAPWCVPATSSVLPKSLVTAAEACSNPAVLTTIDRTSLPSPADPRMLTMLYLANAAYIDTVQDGAAAVDQTLSCLQRTWGAAQPPVFINKPIPSDLDIKGTATVLLAHTGTDIFIAFRGSDDLGDWAQNLDARPKDARKFFNSKTPVDVHNGFLTTYKLLHDDIKKYIDNLLKTKAVDRDNYRLWVTGHSLGGALATLAGLKLSQVHSPTRIGGVYPFSAPRVGLLRFRTLYNDAIGTKTLRPWYGNDIVTRLPPKVGDNAYLHVGQGLGVCGGPALDAQGREVALPLVLGQDEWCIRASADATLADHSPSVLWDGLLRALPGLGGGGYGACVLKALTACPGARNDNCNFLGRCDLATSGRCLTCSADATCAGYWSANAANAGGRCQQSTSFGGVRRCVV